MSDMAYPQTASIDKEHTFGKEINAEWVLDDVGLHEFADTPISNIRPDHVDADPSRVDHYAALMEDGGALFPPLIARRTDNGLELLGGAHRLAAARKIGKTKIPCYVFPELTERQALDLRVIDNLGHGLELTKEEKLKLADLMINKHGAKIPEAAWKVGLPDHVVRRHRNVAKAEQRLRHDAGISGQQSKKLSRQATVALDQVRNPRAYKETAKLAADNNMKARQVNDLVKAVNQEPTEKAKLELIRREKSAIYDHEKPRRGEYVKLASSLSNLEKVDFSVARHQAKGDDMSVIFPKMETVHQRLGSWLSELGDESD